MKPPASGRQSLRKPGFRPAALALKPPFVPPLHRRPLRLACALSLLALQACVAPRSDAPTAPPFAGFNVLPRWRAPLSELNETLRLSDLNLFESEAAGGALPLLDPKLRARLEALADRCHLAPEETLALDRIHGPETPFPDHQPLRQLAATRTVLARLALAEGKRPRALALVRQNLAQARATLTAQQGLMPLVHASGVWESALDGVHALAADPALTPDEAGALLAGLRADARLAQIGITRAMQGELDHVYRVVVERLPQTDSPDLLLTAISSLGMAPPEPPAEGETEFGRTRRLLLDVPATLAAYQADLAPYLASLAQSSRLPRGLHARTTARTLETYREELGALYLYATTDGPAAPALLADTRARIEATENPCGKLLACFLTPPWEVLILSTLRREAKRSALCGLLAWRIHGRPAPWHALAHLLPEPPADPFSDGALLFELSPRPRVWSVFRNGTDDGGLLVDDNSGQPDDLVWLP
jgi:hypothetical protein